MDFLQQVSEQQEKLADQLAAELGERMKPALLQNLRTLAAEARTQIDEKAAMLYVEGAFRHDVHRALAGYSDWLALRLLRTGRSGDSRTVPLPNPTPAELERIVEEYDVESGDMLTLVIEAMSQRSMALPAVGMVSRNQVTPNLDLLKRWADHFDLSE
jgi:hypothetical protein